VHGLLRRQMRSYPYPQKVKIIILLSKKIHSANMDNPEAQILISKIFEALIFQKKDTGENLKRTYSGSNVKIAQLDELKTRENIQAVATEMLEQHTQEGLLDIIRESVRIVKHRYDISHNGFRANKKHPDFITIDEFTTFFGGLSYLYDIIVSKVKIEHCFGKIGIGVIAPAIQDIGKNIIRMEWISGGYDVIDLGRKVKPLDFLAKIIENTFDAIGISCMRNECIENLDLLLQQMNEKKISIPVIIGGIAVNPVTAYTLTNRYKIPVYYCKDVSEAESVLKNALNKAPIAIPDIKEPREFSGSDDISKMAKSYGFSLYQISTDNIVIDEHARDHCLTCPPYKKERCPLEIGYEKKRSLQESKDFISEFAFGLIVVTPATDEDFKDKIDTDNDKKRWSNLIDIESAMARTFGFAYAFKFPLVCPFCSAKDCTLQKGFCTMGTYYRSLHETYNINIFETVKNIFGEDTRGDLYSLILIKSAIKDL